MITLLVYNSHWAEFNIPLASAFPKRNFGLDICPFPTFDSQTFFSKDRTIVQHLLITVGHFQPAAGHQVKTFYFVSSFRHKFLDSSLCIQGSHAFTTKFQDISGHIFIFSRSPKYCMNRTRKWNSLEFSTLKMSKVLFS